MPIFNFLEVGVNGKFETNLKITEYVDHYYYITFSHSIRRSERIWFSLIEISKKKILQK